MLSTCQCYHDHETGTEHFARRFTSIQKTKTQNDVRDVGKRNPHEEVGKLGVGANAVMNGEPPPGAT